MQYNAIVDQATISGSNIYGALWTGPPATTFLAENQTVSLMGLISSLYFGNATAISTSPSSSKVAPVAGGVVGGLAFVAILATAALILHKRKKRQQASNLHDAPVPFMAQTSSATQQPHAATISSETTPTFMARTKGALAAGQSHTATTIPEMIPKSSEASSIPVGRREKQHRQNPTIETTTMSTSTRAPNSRPAADPSASSQSSDGPVSRSENRSRGDQLPTSELVRLLNERLQVGTWDMDEEMPPEYPSNE